jgi:monovalent cation:proton antiporter-2 (CPA2) family protein
VGILDEAVIFLAAAMLVVPLFRRLGLGDVLGYLCAGVLVGPSGFALIAQPDDVLHFAEIGVVFLLFVIGLELQPSRLWVFRRLMFGLGTLQLLSTMAVFACVSKWLGYSWPASIAVGGALALSSTAFVFQLMGEKKELLLPHGRAAFGVLLLQDMAVIPLVALTSMLIDGQSPSLQQGQIVDFVLVLAKLGAVLVVGRYLLRYALRVIVAFRHRELLTAASLLLVIGSGLLFEQLGLSMGLGAFAAGVLMADSEYRHQLEADIIPFKGLLLGLFFIAVGMSVNTAVLFAEPVRIAVLTLGLVSIKWLIVYGLAWVFGLRDSSPIRLGILLAQGGEFAFVLLMPAFVGGLIQQELYQTLVLVVTLSMICTPLLFAAEASWRNSRLKAEPEPEYDVIEAAANKILLVGFGRVGQIVARVLHSRNIPFVALDSDPKQIEFVRKFGNKVYYGDACRADILEAAGIGRAEIFVCAIGNIEDSMRIAEYVRKQHPDVKFFARARNRQHALALRALGADVFIRDTFLSSLSMAKSVLQGLGLSEAEARKTTDMFRQHDEQTLDKQFAVREDDEAVVQLAKDSQEQLKYLFEEDKD